MKLRFWGLLPMNCRKEEDLKVIIITEELKIW